MDDITKINDKSLSVFKAHLIDYNIGACDMTDCFIVPPKSMFLKRINNYVGQRDITLVVDFEGEDITDATLQKSKLTSLLRQGADILLPDNFYYYCMFRKEGKAKQKAPWILQSSFTLSGFRHGVIKQETLTVTGDIFIEGDCETEVKIEITTEQTSITVNGITITNIIGPVIIDGMEKKITQNGVNKFADSNLIEFPKLHPGVNTITIDGTATVKISYYPIYL